MCYGSCCSHLFNIYGSGTMPNMFSSRKHTISHDFSPLSGTFCIQETAFLHPMPKFACNATKDWYWPKTCCGFLWFFLLGICSNCLGCYSGSCYRVNGILVLRLNERIFHENMRFWLLLKPVVEIKKRCIHSVLHDSVMWLWLFHIEWELLHGSVEKRSNI